MKKILLLTLLLAPGLAHAYSEMQGANPYSTAEIETKAVLKATLSAAIAVGDVLSYDTTANDGFTVVQAGYATGSSQVDTDINRVACVAARAMATASTTISSTSPFVPSAPAPCITRGAAVVKYDSTAAGWVSGSKLCVNAVGKVISCLGYASSPSSVITALSTISAAGTGTTTVLINSR